MPNRVVSTRVLYARTSTGKVIKATPSIRYEDVGEDRWDVTVFSPQMHPEREFMGWDEARVLTYMEWFESGD